MNLDAISSIAATIEKMKPDYIALSDSIWDFAELKFEEQRSSQLLARTLEENSFAVRRGVASMETAFIGEAGSGKPVIAFLGEFDALAGMSQTAGVSEPLPEAAGQPVTAAATICLASDRCWRRWRLLEEALAVANDTPFGLSAAIAATSLKYATHFKRNSEAGMVMVNLPTAGVDFHVPFGGRKASSFGPREQGRYAAEFFKVVKTAYASG
ncbi:aldehyde dehydrogenase family protein [Neorhizobium sp. S3-V5DH]|nr:aldehyde dehydrogenase family protein [Neorhizobium sp. S3-V5DH]